MQFVVHWDNEEYRILRQFSVNLLSLCSPVFEGFTHFREGHTRVMTIRNSDPIALASFLEIITADPKTIDDNYVNKVGCIAIHLLTSNLGIL